MDMLAETLRTGAIPHEQTDALPGSWQEVYRDEFRNATTLLLPELTGLAEQVFTSPITLEDETLRDLRSQITEVSVQHLISEHISSRLASRFGGLSENPVDRAREHSKITEYTNELMSRIGLDPEEAQTTLADITSEALAERPALMKLAGSIHRSRDQVKFNDSLAALFSGILTAEAGEKLSRYATSGSKSALTIDTLLSEVSDAMARTDMGVMERERMISRGIGSLHEAVSEYLFSRNKSFHLNVPYERLSLMMGHMAAEMRLPRQMRASMTVAELYDSFFPPVEPKARNVIFAYRTNTRSGFKVVSEQSDRFSDRDPGPRRPDWRKIGMAVGVMLVVTTPILSACAAGTQVGVTQDTQPTPLPTDTTMPSATHEVPPVTATPETGSMGGLAPLTDVASIVNAVPGLAPLLVSPDARLVSNSESLQKTLNDQGWLPVESQGVLAAFVRNGNTALCSISPLEKMVDPLRQIDPSTGQLMANSVFSEKDGVLSFGRSDGTLTWQVPRVIALPDNLPDGVSCLAAINKSDASLQVLVIDGSGAVLGSAGIVFTPDQDVRITNVNGEPSLVVDGQEIVFKTPSGDVLAFTLPTPTPEPTLTPTPEPTATPKPEIGQLLLQAATEAGVVFPQEVSSTYEDPNGQFGGSISFSQALSEAARFSDTEIPEWLMRRVFLDVFGHIAYASLYNNPEYDNFQVLVPGEGEKFYANTGDSRYVTLAEQFFQNGSGLTVQFSVDYADYARQIGTAPFDVKDIHMHFIKMSEFEALKAAFDQNHITYAVVFTDGWYQMGKAERRGLVVIDHGTIHLFGYENGTPGTDDMGWKPMEQLKNGSDIKRMKAFQELILVSERWFGLLFLSPNHPMVPSILTGINMPLMCASSLDNFDKRQDWGQTCAPIAEDMFR